MRLELHRVTKEYRRGERANESISFSVKAGEVFGVLGHNGAGKTTLVNQIVGLIKPTSGSITISGTDAVADPDFARKSCSIQPQVQAPITGITPRQAVELVGRIRGENKSDAARRTHHLFERLGLVEWADTRGEHLSGGVRRLVGFCMTAVCPGKVTILDEPSNDVDPVRRRLLWEEVRNLADEYESSVLLVTHNVLESERVVDAFTLLDEGRQIVTGKTSTLKSYLPDGSKLELVLDEDASKPLTLPTHLTRVVCNANKIVATISSDRTKETLAWAQQLREEGLITEFSVGPPTLEDLYIRLTSGSELESGSEADSETLRADSDILI